ncbi:hypothetical protein GJ496_006518 [Pomphorhynchus laevis]|nr:hypothetical protein GJ496_006518 [Pomphorhynchus laevis]
MDKSQLFSGIPNLARLCVLKPKVKHFTQFAKKLMILRKSDDNDRLYSCLRFIDDVACLLFKHAIFTTAYLIALTGLFKVTNYMTGEKSKRHHQHSKDPPYKRTKALSNNCMVHISYPKAIAD